MGNNRIIFMGTPEFAVPALQALVSDGLKPVAVYTQPPRAKGRGKTITQSPVHQLADLLGIPVYTPTSFKKDPEALENFRALQPDLCVVAAYGLILPGAVLECPRYGCINIHASLLPRWRGASPIQHAIWKGDEISGVTLMQMELGLDTGPMLQKRECPISDDMTAADLHDRLASLGAEMTPPLVRDILNGDALKSEVQDDALSTYAPMLSRSDGAIHWQDTAQEIDRQIRGLTPWPGTWVKHQSKTLKIHAAEPIASSTPSNEPGTVLNKQGDVACANHTTLRLITVQPEGKAHMSVSDAINGGYLKVGDVLS